MHCRRFGAFQRTTAPVSNCLSGAACSRVCVRSADAGSVGRRRMQALDDGFARDARME